MTKSFTDLQRIKVEMADALLCVWITEKHFVVCLHTHTAAEIQQEVQQFNKPNLLKSVSEMRLTDGRF